MLSTTRFVVADLVLTFLFKIGKKIIIWHFESLLIRKKFFCLRQVVSVNYIEKKFWFHNLFIVSLKTFLPIDYISILQRKISVVFYTHYE